MSEEEKKEDETPDTPETPESESSASETEETPEESTPETPEASDSPAEEESTEESTGEEASAEESEATEENAEDKPADPAPSTPAAPLPVPTGPNKGILIGGIGGVVLLILLIAICACCLFNPFGGDDEAKGKSLGKKVVSALKSNKPDNLKKDIATREEMIDHMKKVKFKHLTDLEKLEIYDEGDFSKGHGKMMEALPNMLPSEVPDPSDRSKKIAYDEAQFAAFKKQFEEIQTKLLWDDAKIESVIWDFNERMGLQSGSVYIRIKMGDKVGILTLRDVTYSKVTGEFGWGSPRARTYITWQEVKKED